MRGPRRGAARSCPRSRAVPSRPDGVRSRRVRRRCLAPSRNVFAQFLTAEGDRRATPARSNARPPHASSTTASPDGGGAGVHGSNSGMSVSRWTSRSTVRRSTPEMPSTMQWWTLQMSAHRLSESPSTTHVSQSGRARSSGCDMRRAMSAESSASPPGAGNAVRRTWYERLKCGSSTHTGRPSSNGAKRTRWR